MFPHFWTPRSPRGICAPIPRRSIAAKARGNILRVLVATGLLLVCAPLGTAQSNPSVPSPAAETEAKTIVVAADGTAEFRTLGEAIRAIKVEAGARTIIRLSPGIYREKIVVPSELSNLTIVGEDQISTVLTWNDGAETNAADGKPIGTSASATLTVKARDFSLENITVQNSHGVGSQAVALRVQADRFVARRCRILGWQDTLLVEEGRQYFEECLIEGHVDFVFGPGTAFFDRCRIHVLGNGYIAAPSTPKDIEYGLVFHRCRVTAEPGMATYLARPWREYGHATFLRCTLPDAIRRAGWHNWDRPEREATARFAEFGSLGPGANQQARASWSRQLTQAEAEAISVGSVLAGPDAWKPSAAPRVAQPGKQISDGPTLERIQELPEPERAAWQKYVAESARLMAQDKAVLASELQAAGLPKPLVPNDSKKNELELNRDAEWYRSPEAMKIAEAVVSFQVPSGGWSKAVSYMQGPRQPGMHWSSQASEATWHYVGTYDNGSTIQQLRFLAKVFAATKTPEFQASWKRGFEYILTAEYPNGGWPQVFPLEGGYHDAVTFNDNAMVRVLEFLRDVANGTFEVADESDRTRAEASLRKGIDFILQSQFVRNGKPTVWCAQHDPITRWPVAARLKEPASLSGGESVGIVKFLAKLPDRTPEIESALDDALAWFWDSKLTGLREAKRDGRSFWERDESAAVPVWARFYDVATNQPIFAGAQDGIIYDEYETMWRNNRFGYDFYTPKPNDLLKEDRR